MVSVVQGSAVQESISDNTRTSSLNNISSISTVDSTLRISSDSSSARKQPICKYAASKQVCPFGTKCRYRHPTQRPRTVQPVCRHFLQGQCRYGNRCKFRHPKQESVESSEITSNESQESTAVLNVSDFPSISLSKTASKSDYHGNVSQPLSHPDVPSDKGSRRVIHHDGSQTAPVELQLAAFFKRATTITTKPAVPRPGGGGKKSTAQQKSTGADKLDQIMKTELRLLQEENVEETEPRDEEVYILQFQPSSPEWIANHGKQTIQLIVKFPIEFPTQPFSVQVIDDGSLVKSTLLAINDELEDQISIMHSESVVPSGHIPFFKNLLNWLDNNIMDISDKSRVLYTTVQDDESMDGSSEEEAEEWEDEESEEDLSPAEFMRPHKKGTEIRLVDLALNKNVATLQLTQLKLTVQCTRCKNMDDVLCIPEKRVLETCEKCQAYLGVTIHTDIVHPSNTSMCYMDIIGLKPVEVVLPRCEFTVTCLECQKECVLKGWSYGDPLHVSCRGCHSRLQVALEGCKFIAHQSGPQEVEGGLIPKKKKQKPKDDFLIQEGRPLPEFGTCLHYKRSHRWLRFPCCGKSYPCDVCHDMSEDHPMERANRMICGYCSKEQVYSGIKPCVSCGSDMAQIRSSAHWEGGKGCRNKSKMNRNDPHKYKFDNKVVSKKDERVGLKGKINRQKNQSV